MSPIDCSVTGLGGSASFLNIAVLGNYHAESTTRAIIIMRESH